MYVFYNLHTYIVSVHDILPIRSELCALMWPPLVCLALLFCFWKSTWIVRIHRDHCASEEWSLLRIREERTGGKEISIFQLV